MSKAKKYTFFVGGLLIMLCSTLSSYGIATITPKLLTQYDAMQHYTLTSLMASIGMLIFLPVCGKLIDTVGRKAMLMIGGGIFLVFSVICGMATNFPVFIVSRGLITIGSACLAAIPSSSLPLVFEKKELPALYGIQGGILALGTFFGSTIAGAMSDMGVMWLAAAYPGVLTMIGALMMFALMPQTEKKPMPSIDFIGILLLALFVGPLTLVSSLGKSMGWTSPLILGGIALMIIAVILLVVVEKKIKNPLINMDLFKNRVFTAALLASFFIVCYQSAMRVYVPLQVQTVLGESATVSGTVLLPRSILSMILPTFVGAWISKDMHNRAWKAVTIAGLLVTVGMLITGFVPSLMGCFIGLGLTGIAESFKQSSITPTATGALPKDQYGSGMSLISMAGTMGSAVGAAIYGIVQGIFVDDTANIAQVALGNKMIFLAAAVTGAAVMLLGLLAIRPKNKQASEA